MGRIVLAGLVLGLCTSLAAPIFAQTNERCMLRCLDHTLYEICHARCTKGAAPAQAPTPGRTTPTDVPASASTPSPAAIPQPSAPQPAGAQPAPQPRVLPPAQPAANQAPQPTVPMPERSAKPTVASRPVNEMCVLRCLDHGRLDQQCEAICAK